MYFRVDNWFFDKIFQPFADWFHEKTGLGPFWLSAVSACLTAAIVTVKQLLFPSDSWLWVLYLVLMIVLLIHSAFVNLKKDKRTATKLTLNHNRSNGFHRFLRMIFLITAAAFIVTLPLLGMNQEKFMQFLSLWTFVCFFYFEACDQKPPPPPKTALTAKPVSA